MDVAARRSLSPRFALTAIAAAVAGVAHAATATGTLSVSALVLSTCVVSPATLAFGTYAFGQVDSTATISVNCTSDVTDFSVSLGAGTGTGASTTVRKMTSLTNATLDYRLFRDAARTANWGDASAERQTRADGTVLGTTRNFTVYGRVPADQTVEGSGGGLLYSDSVTITVNY